MTRVIIIAEGETEERFTRVILAPFFALQGIFLEAWGMRGALTYPRVQKWLVRALKEQRNAYVTTFFDLYALNDGFPEYALSQRKRDVYERLTVLENAFHKDIVQRTQCKPERFIPYIQPHEFEGLLFADTERLVEVEPEWENSRGELARIRQTVSTPELLNDGPQTHPSVRLERMLTPTYRKTTHGPLAVQKIGLDKIRQECPHFAHWFNRLTQLPAHD